MDNAQHRGLGSSIHEGQIVRSIPPSLTEPIPRRRRFMILDESQDRRLREELIDADLVVVGGGIAGVCASITAAREGLKVTLVQDRPVLGGNASSEIRLWMVGATSHLGNNNRWGREGGVVNEILLENTYRNPEGNPVLFDTVLLDKVAAEANIRLLLNTAVFEVDTSERGAISEVRAFSSQNSTRFSLRAPLFCDASGDGVVGFLAGAAYRIGAESQAEFGELLAPSEANRKLLGHSIYFYTHNTGRSVSYVPPDYALQDISRIPRFKRFNTKEHGTDLWWIEYGGSLDTVHETEHIKWELWKIIYGVWNHIKNSGEFDDAEKLTLDWVGLIPGKRESRRFEGDYMLTQQDVVEQRVHADAVSYGGWAIDHHPVDNIYSNEEPCTQWHGKGVYQIPYRTMYSREVPNLFLAGRLISVSHIAFGSTRVMATCGHNAQAVAIAAAICRERQVDPRDLSTGDRLTELQQRLLRRGQYIPATVREDPFDLAQRASITATSTLDRIGLPVERVSQLSDSRAILLPAVTGEALELTLSCLSDQPATLDLELRTSSRTASFSPDVTLDRVQIDLPTAACHDGNDLGFVSASTPPQEQVAATPRLSSLAFSGKQDIEPDAYRVTDRRARMMPLGLGNVTVRFDADIVQDQYVFVCLGENRHVRVGESKAMVTGITTVRHASDAKVSRRNRQIAPPGSGIDDFEFWTPQRRPGWRNLAVSKSMPTGLFAPSNVANGVARPTCRPNAWVASLTDHRPTLTLSWDEPQQIGSIELVLDPDWDHPLESIVMQHAENVMPTLVRDIKVSAEDGSVLYKCTANHQAIVRHRFEAPVMTSALHVEVAHPSDLVPASLYEVRCYGEA